MAKIPIFFVGECGELIFTKGTVGRIFKLRKSGRNRTVKIGVFVHFSPIFLLFLSHFASFLNLIPPQISATRIPCAMPAISPSPRPHFPPLPPVPPIFPDSKTLVCELVSSVAVRCLLLHSGPTGTALVTVKLPSVAL